MAVKVAINGFGRIGRLAFRQMFAAEGYEVVAINDLTSPEMLAHLLKYDTAQGRYAQGHTVEAGENYIVVDGKKITIYAIKDAAELPLGRAGRRRGPGVHRLLHQQGEGFRPHQGWRQEGRHLRSCGQRPEDHRLQRQREDPDPRGSDHLRCFLHHQLPGSHGQGSERSTLPSRAAS